MRSTSFSRLDPKKRYLQVALNSTLDEASKIISQLPKNDRIIVEVGTPMIKRYGVEGIRKVHQWYSRRLLGMSAMVETAPAVATSFLGLLAGAMSSQGLSTPPPPPGRQSTETKNIPLSPYIVADLKTMDRGATEVEIAASGGASAAVALGTAPIETLDAFIASCDRLGIDAMIDMMNIDFPLSILRALKKVPRVVILHRGVDEESYNRQKMLPLHEIRRIKGSYDILIAIAGGDTLREVQSAVFNDADIVVIWKSVYQSTAETVNIVDGFLKQIK